MLPALERLFKGFSVDDMGTLEHPSMNSHAGGTRDVPAWELDKETKGHVYF